LTTLTRTAQAQWNGDLKSGNGIINAESHILNHTSYTYSTRFEDTPGTNPEELLASAHAACYTMALAHTLAEKGYKAESLQTQAFCSLESQENGGFKITKMRLATQGQVPNLDDTLFGQIAQEAEKACPISNALRQNVEIELDAALTS
jgi:lipoyl-dependent peroxiredoxin